VDKNSNPLEKRAYHEAGHVVISYLTGYVCKSFKINGKSPLESPDSYDFGEEGEFVSAIYEYKNSPDTYDGLSQVAKNKCRDTALKTIIVLMGGPAAEAVYKNGGKVHIDPFFTISVHDLEAADCIDYFLSIVKQGQHPTNYLQSIFRQVLKLMEIKEVWAAVSALAKAIIESENSKLERKDIEKILVQTGFLAYLSSLKKQDRTANNTAPPPSSISSTSGFTREELEKLKKECRKAPPVSKKDGVAKIIHFARDVKYSNLKIGLTDNPERDLFTDGKVDKNDKSRYFLIETSAYSIAKEILMYFGCLGMEIVPGSSKNTDATTVYVVAK
jgi:hypothetical protein